MNGSLVESDEPCAALDPVLDECVRRCGRDRVSVWEGNGRKDGASKTITVPVTPFHHVMMVFWETVVVDIGKLSVPNTVEVHSTL